MTILTTRSGKGSPLTNNEMDANLNNLNNDKLETSTAATTYTTKVDPATSGTLTHSGDIVLSGTGKLGIGGANYGTAGQVLMSGGPSAAPSWATSSIQSGTVSYFAMATAPSGWLKANGALISRTTYATLFAAIGTTFGAGDGSTTFALPDLRGEFIRSWDDARGVDSGRGFGSSQADQNLSHSHGVTDPGHSHSQSGQSGYTTVANSGNVRGVFDYNTSTGTGYTGISIQSSGGAEARPRNVALLACIKF